MQRVKVCLVHHGLSGVKVRYLLTVAADLSRGSMTSKSCLKVIGLETS